MIKLILLITFTTMSGDFDEAQKFETMESCHHFLEYAKVEYPGAVDKAFCVEVTNQEDK